MSTLADLAGQHLCLRLQPLNRALRAAVRRQDRLASRLDDVKLAEVCLTAQHVDVLLDDVTHWDHCVNDERELGLSAEEAEREAELRDRAHAIGHELPLDRLARTCGLDELECEAVLLCAAPEIDLAYEKIYGYVLDDFQRRAPCVELIASLTAGSIAERLSRRRALGRLGRLRRYGVLRASGDASNEWRQEL